MVLISWIWNEEGGGHMLFHAASAALVSPNPQEHARGLMLHLSTCFFVNRTSDVLKAFCNVLRYNKTVSGKH